MSKITDARDQQKADNAKILANLANIDADMQALDLKIADLLAGGTLSAEDQDALAEIKQGSSDLLAKTGTMADEHPEAPPAGPAQPSNPGDDRPPDPPTP